MHTLLSKFSRRAGLLSAGLLLSACGDGAAGPNATAPFRLSFRAAPSASLADGAAADGAPGGAGVEESAEGLRVTRGDDEILISRLVLVVRDIHMQSPAGSCGTGDDDADDASATAGDTATRAAGEDDDEDREGCPTVHGGPVMIEIPTSGESAGALAVELPEGTYSRIRMRLKAVTGNDSASRAFRTEHPELTGLSVLVEGVQNEKPFTFTTDVGAQLEVPLDEPLALAEAGDQVTVSLDIANWFVSPRGGLYALDSEKANVRAHITNTIRDSFRAFRDRNRDGRKD